MMRYIAAAQALVEVAMIRIHVTACGAVLVGRFYIIKKLRERVVSEERKASTETLFRPDKGSVIAGVADRWVDPRDVAELRKRPPRLRISRSHELGRNLIQTEIV